MKKMKFALPLAIALALTAATAAFAATASVPAGTLNFSSAAEKTALAQGSSAVVTQSVSGIQFGTTEKINVGDKIPEVASKEYIQLNDNRGNNQGWLVSVSATNLTATVKDPVSATNSDMTVSIPASSVLKVKASALEALNNSKVGGISLAETLTPLTNAGVPIIVAGKLKGAGAYQSEVGYALSLPNYLPAGTTLVSADKLSKIAQTDATELGLFAGAYSTTITYSILQAP